MAKLSQVILIGTTSIRQKKIEEGYKRNGMNVLRGFGSFPMALQYLEGKNVTLPQAFHIANDSRMGIIDLRQGCAELAGKIVEVAKSDPKKEPPTIWIDNQNQDMVDLAGISTQRAIPVFFGSADGTRE